MSKRSLKIAHKSAVVQQEALAELQALAKSYLRGEAMLAELQQEMEGVAGRHPERTTTQHDIAYLEDLLRCAKKKLAWETHTQKLRERTPGVLAKVSGVIEDRTHPPDPETRAAILEALQTVQAGISRFEGPPSA